MPLGDGEGGYLVRRVLTPESLANKHEYNRRYRQENAERLRAADRARYVETRGEHLEYARRYREANAEEINRKVREHQRRRRALEKAVVFAYYGEECTCCGRCDDLTIDHIEPVGGGKRPISVFYRQLIAEGFPEGFQSLCRSCNSSKKSGTVCLLHGRTLT